MLRLSKLTDYAVVVLVRLSGGDSVQTSPGIAVSTGIPEPTVAKVLKALAGGELVSSQRGARGGYRLARPLQAIRVSDVIEAIDGPIAMAACVEGSAQGCESSCGCAMRGRWDPVNDAIRRALSGITLADMVSATPAPAYINPPPLHLSARPRLWRPTRSPHRPQPNRKSMTAATETLDAVQALSDTGYKWGFETDIEMDMARRA